MMAAYLMWLLAFADLAVDETTAGPEASFCEGLQVEASEFVSDDSAEWFNEALSDGRFQEVYWALRQVGDVSQAVGVADCLTEILTHGPVLEADRLGGGISATAKVSLPRGVSAVFKTTNSFKGCYRNEIAAYQLDKRLDLDIVPMTVSRTIDGKTGSLQYFVTGAIPAHQAKSPRRTLELRVLDLLIDNEDRHGGNWLFYDFDGYRKLVAIDHNLTFGCRKEFGRSAQHIKNVAPQDAQRLSARLAGLSDDELETLLATYIKRNRAIRRSQKARQYIMRRLEVLARKEN